MRNVLYIICVLLLSGCASQQKQADRAYRFFRQNPNALARLCADQYPVKEQWIAGKEIIHTDTIRLAGETIPCPAQDNQKTAFIRCPGAKTIIQKVFKTDTLVRENSARIVQLSGELQTSLHQGKIYYRIAKGLGWILFSAILFGIGYFFIRFRLIA